MFVFVKYKKSTPNQQDSTMTGAFLAISNPPFSARYILS